MYCQHCGAEVGNARFCRKCGAPASTDALAVQSLPQTAAVGYEKGFKKLFMGLAFLFIAIFPVFSRGVLWWWMLIPAAPLLAAGIGELVRARRGTQIQPARFATLSAEPGQMRPAQPNELPRARNTSELVPLPPSVTEGTTRLLDEEKARRD